jgi:hypothetical protein
MVMTRDAELSPEQPDGYLTLAESARISAMIVVAAPSIGLYGAAAATAVVFRKNMVIVETREEREADWYQFVVATKPMPVLIHTVRPEGTA